MLMSLFVVMPYAASAEDIKSGEDATNRAWYVDSAAELLNFVNTAHEYLHSPEMGYTVYLTDDIDVSGMDAQLRIGSFQDNNAFTGTFDGQGHKITGLTYTAENNTDAGLFAYTNGATIKDLVIENANIKSALRGGIVVGKATNTKIYNVSVRNSSIELFSNGSVISLITAGGMRGGIIAGDFENQGVNPSVMYNCEAVNSKIFIGSTGGVQALGGDGLILGGLVGVASNSTIEYSRVIGDSSVVLDYRMAVGAVNVKMVYSGGLVGEAKPGANIIDCFSTAYVRAQAETYVSVGAGGDGCVGGIVGYAPDAGYNIERCHFAGSLSSRLVNSILVLPIVVMEDYYLSGILGRNDGGSDSVKNCYYDWENARLKLERSGADITAVDGKSDTQNYSSVSHSQYTNVDFWAGKDYDFNGTTKRDTASNVLVGEDHTNRWVMDYDTGMPVHGKAVTAATDFPGAGTVTIGAEGYREAVSTTDSYVTQITDAYDKTVTLTATENPGYIFKGWYEGEIGSDGTVTVIGTEAESETTYNAPADDGTVYVAVYKAKVVYRDPENTKDQQTQEYSFNDTLHFINDPAYAGQRFYGWTEEAGRHLDLNSDTLAAINFTANGSAVTRPMTLYPVFVGVGANIVAVFEENGSSTANDPSLITTTGTDDKGWYVSYTYNDEQEKEPEGYLFDGWYQVNASEFTENQPVDLSNAYCVSREKTYYVDEDYYTEPYRYVAKFKYKVTAWMPEEIETSGSISYFFYVMRNNTQLDPYAEIWASYGDDYEKLSSKLGTPGMGYNESFEYWSDQAPEFGKNYSDGGLSDLNDTLTQFSGYVSSPMNLYGLVNINYYGNTSFITYTDFPGAAKLTLTYNSSGTDSADIGVTLNEGYNFHGMMHYDNDGHMDEDSTPSLTWDNNNGIWSISNRWLLTRNTFSMYNQEYILLKASANVDFHDKEGAKLGGTTLNYANPSGWATETTVTRKYQSKLFGENVEEEAVLTALESTPIAKRENPVGLGTTPAELGMYAENYKFLGWVDREQLRDIDSAYLYDYTDEEGVTESVNTKYITTDSKKADGYILNDSDRVYAYMDIHPVYAKYKVNIATNLENVELTDEPTPEYTVSQDGTVTVKPGTAEGDGFTVSKITLTDGDGNTIELTLDKATGNYTSGENKLDVDETYTVNIEYSYKVTIKYNLGNTIYEEIKNNGETLGTTAETKTPDLSNIEGVFVGWTEQKPDGDSKYVTYMKDGDGATVLVTKDTAAVKDMELYPVYVQLAHRSNIDTDIVKYTKLADSVLTADDLSGEGYAFGGWSMVTGEDGAETSTLVSPELKYTVTKEQAMSAKEFVAIYKPVITYMIPSINGSDVKYSDENTFTETVELDHAITIEKDDDGAVKGQTGTSGSAMNLVMESINDSVYVNVLGWADKQNGNSLDDLYTGTVTGPVKLYPILSTEAPAGMVTLTFVYKTYDTDSSAWEETTSTVLVSEGYTFNMPDPGDYTDANKDKYLFVNWSYGSGQTIDAGEEYTAAGDVIFTAQYAKDAEVNDYTVYSNYDDNSSQSVNFIEGKFPKVSSLGELLRPHEGSVTFIGYALVTIGSDGSRTNDGLYAAGDAVPGNISEYSVTNTTDDTGSTGETGDVKRIYAVWAQIDTAQGAQVRLDENGGMRVMGYVNTAILERVGLNTPDVDYKRSMEFTTGDSFEDIAEEANVYQAIEATSKDWYGNSYKTAGGFAPNTNRLSELDAFSIIAKMEDELYSQKLAFRAQLTFTYTLKDAEDQTRTADAYGTFNAENNIRAMQDIAKTYLEALKDADPYGESNYYGIGETAYNNLLRYAGETASGGTE